MTQAKRSRYNVSAGMATTVADTSCTLDVECYKIDKIGGIGSDIMLNRSNLDQFTCLRCYSVHDHASGVVAGDVLDVRIAIACNDAATGTAVTPTIAAIDLLADIKG
jgi:hypothetical protein